MAQYTPWDYEQAQREGRWNSNKGYYSWRQTAEEWARQQRGGPVQRLEQWASGFDLSKYTTKDEAKNLYEGRLNDIQKAFQQMQTEQDQKWSTWNARWDEANKPQLLNVGGSEMPIGGVGNYIDQMNQYWGGQFQQQDRQFQQQNQMLQQQGGRLQSYGAQNRNLRDQQAGLESQLRDQQRRRTSDWANPRQDYSMYRRPRYGGGYGGGGYNDQLTIDNLNI